MEWKRRRMDEIGIPRPPPPNPLERRHVRRQTLEVIDDCRFPLEVQR